MSKTPSGWHDDARHRDAGHDEMQIEQIRKWKKARAEGETFEWTFGKDRISLNLTGVWAEFPFVERGKLIGFADIAIKAEEPRKKTEASGALSYAVFPRVLWVFFELKPKIESIGAILRQCQATEILAKRWIASVYRNQHGTQPEFMVRPIVYRDDPKAGLLEELDPSTWPVPRL